MLHNTATLLLLRSVWFWKPWATCKEVLDPKRINKYRIILSELQNWPKRIILYPHKFLALRYRLDCKKRDLTDVYARGKIMSPWEKHEPMGKSRACGKITRPKMVLIARGQLTPSECEGFSQGRKCQLDLYWIINEQNALKFQFRHRVTLSVGLS